MVINKMERNHFRKSIDNRLEVIDLEYDIKRLSTEMNYHKSKAVIFEQTINAQQIDLDEILGISEYSTPGGENIQMKITRILPKFLAKTYQEESLRRAEDYLVYHRGMVRVFEEVVEEGRIELERLKK